MRSGYLFPSKRRRRKHSLLLIMFCLNFPNIVLQSPSTNTIKLYYCNKFIIKNCERSRMNLQLLCRFSSKKLISNFLSKPRYLFPKTTAGFEQNHVWFLKKMRGTQTERKMPLHPCCRVLAGIISLRNVYSTFLKPVLLTAFLMRSPGR